MLLSSSWCLPTAFCSTEVAPDTASSVDFQSEDSGSETEASPKRGGKGGQQQRRAAACCGGEDSDSSSSSSSTGLCSSLGICREAKFHLVPKNGWHPFVKKMGCSAENTIKWFGEGPVPLAPADCWLLPTSDDMALCIATMQPALAAAGWKLLTCAPHTVNKLSNKAGLYHHAKDIGLLEHLPKHWMSPEACEYPCILKAAVGQHGKDVYIVRSAAEVRAITEEGFGSKWLLQELLVGQMEYSVSLLVKGGQILEAILTEYKYSKEEYVWPNVEEVHRRTRGHIPAEHLLVMQAFLSEYSGICNFNYKVRPSGEICVFEINTRVGADLACDVPRRRARRLFEKLDELTPRISQKMA